MSNVTKCKICNKQIDKSQAIQIKSKIYVCCDECRKAYEQQETTNQSRKELLDYIDQICPNANFPHITTQLKRMMDTNPEMTYGGIRYTIWFIKNHVGKDVSVTPLGLVPYYYDEAANYYKWLRQIKNQIVAYDFVQNEETVIKTVEEEDVFD